MERLAFGEPGPTARAPLRGALLAAALLLAGCGGLENPDLSSGAVAGRIAPAFPGGKVYLFGRPDLAAPLAADGSFYLTAPAGPAVLVALDGGAGAGLIGLVVRGGDITWLGFDPEGGAAPVGSADAPPVVLAPAGFLTVTARSTAGSVLQAARFTLAGTDQRDVAPDATGQAKLGPLPAGTFELRAGAPGLAEARLQVEVVAGQDVARDVTLAAGGG